MNTRLSNGLRVLILCGISFMYSCTHFSPLVVQLTSLEEDLSDNPDSVLNILNEMHVDKNSDEHIQAYYALLLAMAQDKCGTNEIDDSLICRAVDFYSKTQDSRHCMYAYFYKGRMLFNEGLYEASISNFRRAENEADKLKDYHALGLIYQSICVVYLHVNNAAEAIKYSERSYQSMQQDGDCHLESLSSLLVHERRMGIIVSLLFIMVVFLLLFIVYILVSRRKRESLEYSARIETMHELVRTAQKATEEETIAAKVLLGEHVDMFDRLCIAYYEQLNSPTEKRRLMKDMQTEIQQFVERKDVVDNLENYVDSFYGQIMKNLRVEFPSLKEAEYRFFLFIVAGFSPRAISLFMGIRVATLYVQKSRLKEKLIQTQPELAEKYLVYLNAK